MNISPVNSLELYYLVRAWVKVKRDREETYDDEHAMVVDSYERRIFALVDYIEQRMQQAAHTTDPIY